MAFGFSRRQMLQSAGGAALSQTLAPVSTAAAAPRRWRIEDSPNMPKIWVPGDGGGPLAAGMLPPARATPPGAVMRPAVAEEGAATADFWRQLPPLRPAAAIAPAAIRPPAISASASSESPACSAWASERFPDATGAELSQKALAEGWRVLRKLVGQHIEGKYTGGKAPSLHEMFAVYAPASDGNDPEAYARFVAIELGVAVNSANAAGAKSYYMRL